MLLGKRPRPTMSRTTSLTEISIDLGGVEAPQAATGNPPHRRHHQRAASGMDAWRQLLQQQQPPQPYQADQQQQQYKYQYQHPQGASDALDTRYLSMVSPRNPQRNSGDFAVEPAHFLRACGLCKRRLGPGRDTFMYRGEVAFCSLECRQQQMNQDERKEKCSLTSVKKELPQPAADGETVAAE